LLASGRPEARQPTGQGLLLARAGASEEMSISGFSITPRQRRRFLHFRSPIQRRGSAVAVRPQTKVKERTFPTDPKKFVHKRKSRPNTV